MKVEGIIMKGDTRVEGKENEIEKCKLKRRKRKEREGGKENRRRILKEAQKT